MICHRCGKHVPGKRGRFCGTCPPLPDRAIIAITKRRSHLVSYKRPKCIICGDYVWRKQNHHFGTPTCSTTCANTLQARLAKKLKLKNT